MLDDRPLVQKSLIGAGAFAFVFLAAMGGTAFMISGGIDLSDEHPGPRNAGEVVNVVQDTWSDWAVPSSQAASARQQARIIPASADAAAIAQGYSDAGSSGDLDGADAQVTARDRSEDEVVADIQREYEAATNADSDAAQASDEDVWADESDNPKANRAD